MKRTRWSHYKYLPYASGGISVVSRKTKKYILGRKLNKRQLRERIAAVVITRNEYPKEATISDVFCPKCGCDEAESTGNMAGYPELWVRHYCMRCGNLVGEADNSPFCHVLEFPDNNYVLY